MTCYSRYDYAAKNDPTTQALTTSFNTTQVAPFDPTWYPSSGATNHITTDLVNLSIHSEYQGNDHLQDENGSSLRIENISSSILESPSSTLKLKDILDVSHVMPGPHST